MTPPLLRRFRSGSLGCPANLSKIQPAWGVRSRSRVDVTLQTDQPCRLALSALVAPRAAGSGACKAFYARQRADVGSTASWLRDSAVLGGVHMVVTTAVVRAIACSRGRGGQLLPARPSRGAKTATAVLLLCASASSSSTAMGNMLWGGTRRASSSDTNNPDEATTTAEERAEAAAMRSKGAACDGDGDGSGGGRGRASLANVRRCDIEEGRQKYVLVAVGGTGDDEGAEHFVRGRRSARCVTLRFTRAG